MPGHAHRPNKTPIAYKYASLPSSPSRPSPPPSPRFRFRNVLIPSRSSAEGLGIDLPGTGLVGGTGVAVKVGEGDGARQEHRTDYAALKGTINDPANRQDYFGNTAALGGVGAPAVTWGHGDDQVEYTSDPDTFGRRAERVKGLLRGMVGGPAQPAVTNSAPPTGQRELVSPTSAKHKLWLSEPSAAQSDDYSLDGAELEQRIRYLLRRGSEHYRRDSASAPGTPRRGSLNVQALGLLMSRRQSSFDSSSLSMPSDQPPTVSPAGQKTVPISAANGQETARRVPVGVDNEDEAHPNPLRAGLAQMDADARYRETFLSARGFPSTPKHDPAEMEVMLAAEEQRLERRLEELKRQKKMEKQPVAIEVSSGVPLVRREPSTNHTDRNGIRSGPKSKPITGPSGPSPQVDLSAGGTVSRGPPTKDIFSEPVFIHQSMAREDLTAEPSASALDDRDGGEETSTAFDDALHAMKGCLKTLHRMYSKAEILVNDPVFPTSSSRSRKLNTLISEGIVYAAELINAKLADELDGVLQGVTHTRAGPAESVVAAMGVIFFRLRQLVPLHRFKLAASAVKDIMQQVDKGDLVDAQARQARREILSLRDLVKEKVNQMEGSGPVKKSKTAKLKSILKPKLDDTSPPGKPRIESKNREPLSEPKETNTPGAGSKHEARIEEKKPVAKGIKDSYIAFKDGGPGLPIPSDTPLPEEPNLYNYNGQVVSRSAMSLLNKEDALARKGGLFERDGVIMTASALSLLQAQEMMERADTSGQGEWGPDTWDPIRGQYIPKWAKKLTEADRWPLVDDEGHRLRDENGDVEQDWFDPNLEVLEAKNLLQFGMEGVVDYPY